MVNFGGWDMPVEYSGIVREHMATRTAAGLFDVSHMGEIEVRGPHAL
jgi:aminomethyltransferase